MSNTQLVLRDVCGPLTDLMKKLSGDDGEQWLFALKRFNRKENPWGDQKTVKPRQLLQLVTTVDLQAVEAFLAKDYFKVGEVDGVKIGWLGDNFKDNFSDKTESNIEAANLRIHKLRRRSLDGPIIAELGGEEQAEITLAQMWEMLKRQGQRGGLLTNGYANIFYIRDPKGVLWAVYCRWSAGSGFWYVGASSVAYPNEWRYDYRVFSL